MKVKYYIASSIVALCSLIAQAHEGDDPLLTKIMLHEFERYREDSSSNLAVNAEAWIGKDLHKFWLKTDLDIEQDQLESAEYQFLYSHGIDTYWDLQVGIRQDETHAISDRTWAVFAIKGLAPYFFDVEAALFFGESQAVAGRLTAEYEILLTQRWIVSPECELNAYGQTDSERELATGFNEVECGLRMRYEIKRQIAPYIGIHWQKQLGKTADRAQEIGRPVEDTEGVVGIRGWY